MKLQIRHTSRLLAIVLFVLSVLISGAARTPQAGANSDIQTSVKSSSSFPACKGLPIPAQMKAFQLIKSEVCTNLTQLLTVVQTGNQIGTDITTLFNDLQVELSLTPLCAGSLMGVFVQSLISGEVSAASCPAEN